MAKIEAFPESESPQDSYDFDPFVVKRKVEKAGSRFFPPWVFTVALSLLWLLILPGIMSVIAGNFLSGILAGIGLVLASMLALLVYETYSPSWRTVAWAMALSVGLSYAVIQIGDFPGRLLAIIIPTGLLVAARVNMNARKLFARY